MNGEYTPLSLSEAVTRSAKALQIFLDNNVEVIRIGLCSSENLSSEETYFAGPNHVAIGELVKSQIYLEKIIEKTKDVTVTSDDVLKIYVAKNCLSKAIGQKKNNKFLLTQTLKTENIVFCETDKLSEYEVSVVVEGKNKKCT
jgi:histone acetyltransferase (RNA polymerase elongator complex component)